MANLSMASMSATILLLGIVITIPTGVQSIGVCYGMVGNNLPQPSEVVELYKSKKIGQMRIYFPNEDVLQALKGSNIGLILDVPREDLQSLASDPSAASKWVQNNIKSYLPDVSFRYIAVGNEVIPGNDAQYVLPAINNIHDALSASGLQNKIKVSTSVSQGVLGKSYPPSSGTFSSNASSYIRDMKDIKIEYALFTSPGTVVNDPPYGYQNLFDAIVDAIYSALEKMEGSNIPVVVSESGWPSADGTAATMDNAKTYNQNLINHVSRGTPKRPGKAIEAYIFAMFNENQKKPPGIENNFGLLYPNKTPVYPINFG
ncbi:Glucan endo-1,3-beta-glucosidase, basic vacuolar isoform [Cocos nucifera]|uniref:Glucan endo-1,3-beta-glucosidase, basic vacuolar isoform n=1 Tax=Cocos nucifera TaxID=13894 RepID=A0A8K0I645_COCNU|nr:Glucan endo-1,3-beta-glucosidase, basic vacuolar isoform [Cocos nucifera]